MNRCENCGDLRVKKVSAVVDEQTSVSYGPGGTATTSTPLADKLAMPTASISDFIWGLIGYSIGGVILGGIVAGVAGAAVSSPAVTTILMLPAMGGFCGWFGWSAIQELTSQQRAVARRKESYQHEWYCQACGSVFEPGHPATIRDAENANDWS